ncbi:MAG: S9 family peptidase [Flavobacteriales bacterium]|nr:S9 family peptidase [Flavobacteriales bacterium]
MRVASALILSTLLHLTSSVFGQETKDLTLEDIWEKNEYSTEYIHSMRSMEDGLHYTSLLKDKISGESIVVRYVYKTGEAIDTLFRASMLNAANDTILKAIDSYAFNAEENFLILGTDKQRIYRRSANYVHYIVNLESSKSTLLADSGRTECVKFSPNGNSIAFVKENNIYINRLDSTTLQITFDGKRNEIINGKADWVYEEEFAFNRAFFWSSEGNNLAYYKFNETKVREFSFPDYNNLYPKEYQFKYPKAGETNASVSIHLYNLKTQLTKSINTGNDNSIYIPRLKWSNTDSKLLIYRLNRRQNILEVLTANCITKENNISTTILLKEESETYIDVTDDILFLKDKEHFIWSSESNGYNHLYLYNFQGKMVRQLTQGEWDVTKFNGFDENTLRVYFTCTEESPMKRAIYSVNYNGEDFYKLSHSSGTNACTFSKGFNYFINVYSTANTPPITTVHAIDGRKIRTLENNKALAHKITSVDLPKKTFFTFKTEQKIKLNGWMIKPPNFDSFKEYPVYISVYGGPGSQTVLDKWGGNTMMWHHYLAKQGYVIISVDSRGTGSRGAEFERLTYKSLGDLETYDMIETAKYMAKQPFVDSKRIGIQGWSYGGYISTLSILKGAEYFKMAIAVAPVSDWKFYDTIYTERYMQTPNENKEGYSTSSCLTYIDQLKGKYLLIHGTSDDNVHFQNSAILAEELVKQNKQFDSFYYTNKAHSLLGGKTRIHLFTKMTNYILDNL